MIAFRLEHAVSHESFLTFGRGTSRPLSIRFHIVGVELVPILLDRIQIDFCHYRTLRIRDPAIDHIKNFGVNFERGALRCRGRGGRGSLLVADRVK